MVINIYPLGIIFPGRANIKLFVAIGLPASAGGPPARGELGGLIALPELSTKANFYTIQLHD